jgi:ABC-2 type transport system permease protein
MGFLTLPLIFLSTALVPVQAMPTWMGILARFNPMTYATEAVRSLIVGGWEAMAIAKVAAVLIVFDIVSIWFSGRVLQRRMG